MINFSATKIFARYTFHSLLFYILIQSICKKVYRGCSLWVFFNGKVQRIQNSFMSCSDFLSYCITDLENPLKHEGWTKGQNYKIFKEES